MAESILVKAAEEGRWIIAKFWPHAVKRTEAQIDELKAQGLFVRDAKPEDPRAPHDEAEAQCAAAAAALAGTAPSVTATPATPGGDAKK